VTSRQGWAVAGLVVAGAGVASAFLLDRLAPCPAADVARGSEDAFVSGLHARELSGSPKRPQRWTTARVEARFVWLPPGPRTLEVALHQQRQPVAVAVDGEIVGALQPGTSRAEFPLRATPRRDVTVELRLATFVAGDGRRLGAYFDRIAIDHGRGAAPALGLLGVLVGVPLAALAAAGWGGLSCLAATAAALVTLATQSALLFPLGLLRSAYATRLALLLALGAAASAAFGRWRGGRAAGASRPAFLGFGLAFLMNAAVLVSPMVVMSDVMLHANKLRQVAGGDLFPVSYTLNKPPFRFPYGFSFYALLGPLLWAGLDPVLLVRAGAAASGLAIAAGLYVLGEARPGRAFIAVALLLALPISADIFSYGNLSNVFGQAATLWFLAWWIVPRGGPLVGGLLLAMAGLSHLSSLIVLAVLVPLLLWLSWPVARVGGVRLLAVAGAGAVLSAYYLSFLPLILEQLPRLLEGGAGGRTLGILGPLLHQATEVAGRWGWPVLILVPLGFPRSARDEPDRTLLAGWAMGAVLLLAAAVSPVEVRYLYALGFAAAWAAASGAARLWAGGVLGRVAAAALVTWAWLRQLDALKDIVLRRYRL
jgi:hypothetical protein